MLTRFCHWIGWYTRDELDSIVLEIVGARELYGLDIINESNGALKRGTAYLHLNSMVARGVLVRRFSIAHNGRFLYERSGGNAD